MYILHRDAKIVAGQYSAQIRPQKVKVVLITFN